MFIPLPLLRITARPEPIRHQVKPIHLKLIVEHVWILLRGRHATLLAASAVHCNGCVGVVWTASSGQHSPVSNPPKEACPSPFPNVGQLPGPDGQYTVPWPDEDAKKRIGAVASDVWWAECGLVRLSGERQRVQSVRPKIANPAESSQTARIAARAQSWAEQVLGRYWLRQQTP